MLQKKYRISKDKEYKKIFRRSKKFDTENLTFRVVKRQGVGRGAQDEKSTDHKLHTTDESRFGFVVSNKIDKRATRRNGLKRRLRAAVGENLNKIKPGFDVIIIVKKPLAYPYNYKEIQKEVLNGLKKTSLL